MFCSIYLQKTFITKFNLITVSNNSFIFLLILCYKAHNGTIFSIFVERLSKQFRGKFGRFNPFDGPHFNYSV